MSAIIRLVRPEDIPALIDLAAETFLDSFGHYHTVENCQAFIAQSHNVDLYNAAIIDRSEYLLVAEDEGEFVAYLYAKPVTLPVPKGLQTAHELSKIYTKRAAQSSGLGKRLLKDWENWALQQNYKDLVLGVWSDNTGAQTFYARHGYSKISSYSLAVGEVLDTDYIFHKAV